MPFPDVAIQLCTYNRPLEIRKTLAAIFEHVHYRGKLKVHISDDCSPGDYRENLAEWMTKRSPFPFTIQSTESNSGWGANVNLGINTIDTEHIFFLEDDYVLQRKLDLSEGIATLETHQGIGLLRYDGIAGHIGLTCHMIETKIDYLYTGYRQSFSYSNGKISYWLISCGSAQAFVYSNRPHLKHKRFHRYYGLYKEGLKLGETELEFTMRVKDMMQVAQPDTPALAVLPEWVVNWWDDIGKSYQMSDEDKRHA